jgi:HD-like signal output (HDOD) protein
LGAINDVAHRAGAQLSSDGFDSLIEIFHEDIGARVLHSWSLPKTVSQVLAHWKNYRAGGDLAWEGNVVCMADKFADFTLHEPGMLKRDELIAHPAFRDLGFTAEDGEPLFDSASSIDAELDRYMSP